jgi:hypothetical protein
MVYVPIADRHIEDVTREEIEAASRRFLLEDRGDLETITQENHGTDHKDVEVVARELAAPSRGLTEKSSQGSGKESAQRKLRGYKGWRKGVALGIALSTVVLAINVGLAIAAGTRARSLNGQVATMYDGHCRKVRSLSLWLHLLINVLSSLLLGASNYCMQVLCAPTREQVDAAHREKEWMHIGVQSVRNIGTIAGANLLLWTLLALSSLPLHLL